MKLSDIKGERVIDVIADIITPIADIAQDETAAALFKKEKLPEGMMPYEFSISRLKRSLPPLMKTHKKEIVSILSTIKGVSADEYAENLNLVVLMHDLFELIQDEEFLAFFL